MFALEFYSGIGGLHLALQRSNVSASVLRAFDWDQTACQVYAANHGPIVQKVDICSLTASSLASLGAKLWLLSPACQPYTVLNPDAKGALDPRAQSFLHLIQTVLPDLVSQSANPTHILVENVAGFETSSTRQLLLSTLRSLGYTTAEFLLTPLQFGIPNSRLRYYFLAKMTPFAFPPVMDIPQDVPLRYIPCVGRDRQWTDPRLYPPIQPDAESADAASEIRQFLEEELDHIDIHPNAIPDRILEKWGRLFDIVLPSSRRTCCFTRGYTQLVERSGSVLQMNETLDTTEIFDTFLKAQSNGDSEAVRILQPLKLRYFTPSELLRIFNFTVSDETETRPSSNLDNAISAAKDFVWPQGVSTKTKYRLIGNSVNVRVVKELIEFLFTESDK